MRKSHSSGGVPFYATHGIPCGRPYTLPTSRRRKCAAVRALQSTWGLPSAAPPPPSPAGCAVAVDKSVAMGGKNNANHGERERGSGCHDRCCHLLTTVVDATEYYFHTTLYLAYKKQRHATLVHKYVHVHRCAEAKTKC